MLRLANIKYTFCFIISLNLCMYRPTCISINHNHNNFLKCDWCISCFIFH